MNSIVDDIITTYYYIKLGLVTRQVKFVIVIQKCYCNKFVMFL